MLGVGAEKAFSNRFSTSLEAEYNFGGVDRRAAGENTPERTLRWTKGWSVRALAKYNVKI